MVSLYCPSRSTIRTPILTPRSRASWQAMCIITVESLPAENDKYTRSKLSKVHLMRSTAAA
uniref:Co-activator of prophage gene expression IbrA n=1 Tax=uncultured marine virus TaxID=186617 RepID=A0A0F7L2T5_9VIRU|nr:Co-activator of prophage gene expression IbrA [uncultured marine virus]